MSEDGSRIYSIIPEEGKTRMCLDPWAKFFVRANGDVHLCCYGTNVGNLSKGTLDEVLNNEYAKEYRAGLLEGKPLPKCQSCGDKAVCTPEELKEKVQEWYDDGVYFI
jgi:radical SAM protein with 4Fe4S-binding SPASM domain